MRMGAMAPSARPIPDSVVSIFISLVTGLIYISYIHGPEIFWKVMQYPVSEYNIVFVIHYRPTNLNIFGCWSVSE